MATPHKGIPYQFYTPLVAQDDPTTFQVNPTIAAGDFKVSKDGGALVNLSTLPTVAPAGSRLVQIDLSASEMDADKVVVQGLDVAGDEWQQLEAYIDVPTGSVETLTEIQEGDRIESSTRLIINKAGTTDPLIDKEITGSLLTPNVTIRTTDST